MASKLTSQMSSQTPLSSQLQSQMSQQSPPVSSQISPMSRASVIRDPQPVVSYLVSPTPRAHVSDIPQTLHVSHGSQMSSSASVVQRNAIAQQLVQQSLHNSQVQLQRMSQQTRAPPSYSSSQTLTRAPASHVAQLPRVSQSRPPQQLGVTQSPYLYSDQRAVLQHSLTSLQNTRTLSKPSPSSSTSSSARDSERTYMNVQPVAMVARNGRVVRPGESTHAQTVSPECLEAGGGPRTPVIPQSQEVKHKQEPLYSTILGVTGVSGQVPPPVYEDSGAMYANYAPASLYSNYSNYSELEMLRSCESNCDEEEHTEGLPHMPHISGCQTTDI